MNDNIEKKTVAIFTLAAVFVVAVSFFAPDLFRMASVPVETAVQSVADTASSFAAGFDNGRVLKEEIEALKSENIRLSIELKQKEGDSDEIARLRNVIDLTWGKPRLQLAEGKLAAISRGEFRRLFSFICEKAEAGNLVITDTGLVGMVTACSNGLAEAISLSDPGFSVGVRSVRTGDTAVVSGEFSLMEKGLMALSNIDPTADFAPGDLLETINEGLPVGVIEGNETVRPIAELENVLYAVVKDEGN